MSTSQSLTVDQISKELLEVKKGVDEAKISKAKIQGRIEENLKRLQQNHNLSSEEEAIKKVSTLDKQIADLMAKIESKYKGLKEKYDW